MKKLRLLLIAMFVFLLVDFSFAQIEKYIANNETEIKRDVNSSQVIATVPKGTELEIVEKDGSWWNVTCEYNGKTIEGWINESQTVDEVTSEDLEDKLVLTPFQEEYLKAYTYAYVKEANRMNIHLYDSINLQGYYNSYEMKLSSGKKKDIAPYTNKLVNVCSTFVACILHQALGAPLRGETVDGVTYKDTNIRGTSFCNPYDNGSDIFVEVGRDEYLQVGDVLTYNNYYTHAGMYMGYNVEEDCHMVADDSGPLRIRNLTTTKGIGPKITIEQMSQKEKWAEASRLKQSVLPKNWEYPEYVEWPSQFVSGKNP